MMEFLGNCLFKIKCFHLCVSNTLHILYSVLVPGTILMDINLEKPVEIFQTEGRKFSPERFYRADFAVQRPPLFLDEFSV